MKKRGLSIPGLICGVLMAFAFMGPKLTVGQSGTSQGAGGTSSGVSEERPAVERTEQIFEQATRSLRAADVRAKKKRILAENYYRRLVQSVRYGVALSKYANYERKIRWERDRLLRECLEKRHGECSTKDTQQIDERMKYLERQAKEDVETFLAEIRDALQQCQDFSHYDPGGEPLYKSDPLKAKIQRYMESNKEYQEYIKVLPTLQEGFPEIAKQLEAELNHWRPKAVGVSVRPDAPIVPRRHTQNL